MEWQRVLAIGRVSQVPDLSFLVGYLFVRFYLRSVRTHLICTRSSAIRALTIPDRSFKRLPPRLETLCRQGQRRKRKKLMDSFEWILLIESRVGCRGSTRLVRPLCKCGMTCCNHLLSSFSPIEWKKRRTNRRLPFIRYHLQWLRNVYFLDFCTHISQYFTYLRSFNTKMDIKFLSFIRARRCTVLLSLSLFEKKIKLISLIRN